MSHGRAVRRRRLLPDGRACFVALDHVVPRGLAVAPADPAAAIVELGGRLWTSPDPLALASRAHQVTHRREPQ